MGYSSYIATVDDPVDVNAARTLPRLLEEASERWPEGRFLIGFEKSFTYRETLAEVERLAAWLAAQGVGPGDRVALWLSNRPEWVVAQFAVAWVGAILVPVNVRLRRADLASVLQRSGARLVIISGQTIPIDYGAVLADLVDAGEIDGVEKIVAIDGVAPAGDRFVRLPDALPAAVLPAAPVKLDDPSHILYTSGTTSAPKGVVLSHRALANALKSRIEQAVGEVVSFEFPLAAVTGCNGVLGALYAGAALIIHDGRDRARALELARQHKASAFVGHRLLLRDLVDLYPPEDWPTYRRASIFPSDPSDTVVLEKLGITNMGGGYGMTETSARVVVAHWPVSENPSTFAFGRPAYGAQVRIASPDGSDLPRGETGEILVRGPQVMSGYWNDPEATAAAIDKDGWLRTGDLGFVREDGCLQFVERLVDTYKCMGFNVSPGEVEEVIKRLPGIKDCTVVGVPDPREGAKGVAFIIPVGDIAIDPQAVRRYVHGELASFKAPRDVVLVEEFPRTGTGKPLRRVLAAGYVANAQQASEANG